MDSEQVKPVESKPRNTFFVKAINKLNFGKMFCLNWYNKIVNAKNTFSSRILKFIASMFLYCLFGGLTLVVLKYPFTLITFLGAGSAYYLLLNLITEWKSK